MGFSMLRMIGAKKTAYKIRKTSNFLGFVNTRQIPRIEKKVTAPVNVSSWLITIR
jgi:hypothetical protein